MRLPLALCLGLVALATASQSPLQRRVVREVLDYFHGRSNVHFLFKEQAVEGAVERVSAGGWGCPRGGRCCGEGRGGGQGLGWGGGSGCPRGRGQ